MLRKILFGLMLFSEVAFASDACIFSSNYVKCLKAQFKLADTAFILTGTDDPTSVAKDAPKGSLYLRQTGAGDGSVFLKLDTGSSTNWRRVGDVLGPSGGGTDNHIVRWDGASGRLLQNSGVVIDDSDNITGITSANIDGATGNTLVVDTSTLIADATNNRVGVLTTTPGTALDVNGTTTTNLVNVDAATGNTLIVDTSVLVADATNNRVGVGTASPSTTLDVNGSTQITGGATVGVDLTVDLTTLVVDAINNRVGVNTGSPSEALEVNGSTVLVDNLQVDNGTLYVDSTVDAVGIGSSPSGTDKLYITDPSANPVSVQIEGPTGNARLRLTATSDPFILFENTAGPPLNYSLGWYQSGTTFKLTDGADLASGTDLFTITGGVFDVQGGITTPSSISGDSLSVTNLTATAMLDVTGAAGNTLVVDTTTLVVDTTDDRIGIGTAAPTRELSIAKSVSGGTVSANITNSNTAASSSAFLEITTGGDAAGDSYIAVTNTSSAWSFGLDNSDSNRFKITGSGGLSSNDYLILNDTDNKIDSNQLHRGLDGLSSVEYVGTNPESGSDPFQLTWDDRRTQVINPGGAITVRLPTTSILIGEHVTIENRSSTNAVTVTSSDGDTLKVILEGYVRYVALQSTPTDATHWGLLESQTNNVYFESTSSGNMPANNTLGNLWSFSVPPGDWDFNVHCSMGLSGTTWVGDSQTTLCLSTTTASCAGTVMGYTDMEEQRNAFNSGLSGNVSFSPIVNARINLTAATTYYVNVLVYNYTVGTPTYACRATARRSSY